MRLSDTAKPPGQVWIFRPPGDQLAGCFAQQVRHGDLVFTGKIDENCQYRLVLGKSGALLGLGELVRHKG